MTKLCFGGSFNPIHYGHLICARAAAEQVGVEIVRFLIAARSPHKTFAELAADGCRLDMLRLATSGNPFFEVDDRELHRPPPSYTIDTVSELSQEFGSKPKWLIGTDHLPKLHTWHRFDELIERVDFVVMRRAGEIVETNNLDPRVQEISAQLVEVPSVPFSSSEIRARIRRSESIDEMTHPDVVEYIRKNHLYL